MTHRLPFTFKVFAIAIAWLVSEVKKTNKKRSRVALLHTFAPIEQALK